MIRNLREIILNRIAEIIKGNDYDEIYATGKRPALEELEVLNKLLQNISETDLVNVPDEDIKEGDVYRVSDGNTYIKDASKLQKSQHLVVNVLTILSLYGQERH